MRKIFIDAGGRTGKSICRFLKSPENDKTFEIYSFEPVNHLSSHYKDKPDIIFSNKALWIYDGEIDFYISKTKGGWGSTILKEKISGKLDKNHPIKVPCFDFSKWVIDNFNINDYIILSMDIEGAEYKILQKMINDGSIKYIKKLCIEFHYDRIGVKKEDHDAMVNNLKEILSLQEREY